MLVSRQQQNSFKIQMQSIILPERQRRRRRFFFFFFGMFEWRCYWIRIRNRFACSRRRRQPTTKIAWISIWIGIGHRQRNFRVFILSERCDATGAHTMAIVHAMQRYCLWASQRLLLSSSSSVVYDHNCTSRLTFSLFIPSIFVCLFSLMPAYAIRVCMRMPQYSRRRAEINE